MNLSIVQNAKREMFRINCLIWHRIRIIEKLLGNRL